MTEASAHSAWTITALLAGAVFAAYCWASVSYQNGRSDAALLFTQCIETTAPYRDGRSIVTSEQLDICQKSAADRANQAD